MNKQYKITFQDKIFDKKIEYDVFAESPEVAILAGKNKLVEDYNEVLNFEIIQLSKKEPK